MGDDGFAVQGRRRKGATREVLRDRDQESFLRDVPKYAGTPEEYSGAHARRYGREEGLNPDGSHNHGARKFPHGSERERLYDSYNASTRGRDGARDAYQTGLTSAVHENKRMDDDEKGYYKEHTGGLRPDQHEQLDPRATLYRDRCYTNATNRDNFLRAHPHGYHSKKDQRDHHQYASNAYSEYEYASNQQKTHERYRSYSNVDSRKDQWGRPVSHR